MNRDTMNYISRRVYESEARENENRMEHNPAYPDYTDNRISARYNGSTNTYRAEGFIEGRVEHSNPHDSHASKVLNPIGFTGKREHKHKQDFLYEMEESLEKEIDDIVYYSELAMEAEEKGHSEFADGFYEVAKEKLGCAEKIHHRLTKSGHYDPDKQSEIETRFDRAKHLFRRL